MGPHFMKSISRPIFKERFIAKVSAPRSVSELVETFVANSSKPSQQFRQRFAAGRGIVLAVGPGGASQKAPKLERTKLDTRMN